MRLKLKKKLRRSHCGWYSHRYNDTRWHSLRADLPPEEIIRKVILRSGCVKNGDKRCAEATLNLKGKELVEAIKDEWKSSGMSGRADERNLGRMYQFCGFSTIGNKITVEWFEKDFGYMHCVLSWKELTDWYLEHKDFLAREVLGRC